MPPAMEYVRQALSRTITDMHVSNDGTLALMTLDSELEDKLTESVQSDGQTSYLNVDPDSAQKIIHSLEDASSKFNNVGLRPVLLTNPVVRGHLKRFLEKFTPLWVVLSHNEIDSKAKIYSLGTLGI